MVSSMQSVCGTLGIDRVDMRGKIVLIEEQHGCDANFLVSALISNALKKNYGLCFVLFHNTFDHYHNISMRTGYNLTALKEKGKVAVVESMKELVCNINAMCMDIDKKVQNSNEDNKCSGMNVVHNLFKLLKESYNEVEKESESVLIIIDDISHLFDLGLSLRDSLYFVRYIRSLMESHSTTQLCIVAHTYEGDLQSCVPDVVCNSLKYMAHLILVVEPLKTGHSSDASGKVTVCWNIDSVRSEYHWTERMIYLYKLLDWHVKIFAPGAMTSVV
ncbi:hypothetical protein KPH14_001542 [Odynerus spinipes]|uniref:Elongator complex protein 6 n=1 Tax=Odynerus spinipes TaxID=1348599 RepID=A0AAD9RUZ4_9HYME|nr:hypothetical protein KPH14_001542 [Odynerus spinipes]